MLQKMIREPRTVYLIHLFAKLAQGHQHIEGAEERAHASGDSIAELQRPKQIHHRESRPYSNVSIIELESIAD